LSQPVTSPVSSAPANKARQMRIFSIFFIISFGFIIAGRQLPFRPFPTCPWR
jgi:hypothetical protein